jgi:hypothetical protein
MIGLSWLATRQRTAIATVSHLSLRHDRVHQDVVDARVERWIPEFAGVLVSRAVDAGDRSGDTLDQRARERVEIQLAALHHARSQAHVALEKLAGMIALCHDDRARLDATAAWVENVERTLSTLLDGRLAEGLLGKEVIDVARRAVVELAEGELS